MSTPNQFLDEWLKEKQDEKKDLGGAKDGETKLANCVFCGLGIGEIPKES